MLTVNNKRPKTIWDELEAGLGSGAQSVPVLEESSLSYLCAFDCETWRKNHRNKTAKLAFVDEFDAFSIYACSELVKDVHSEHAWCVLE
jgi:hypothetical protein